MDGLVWRFEDHCCARCLGRVVSRQTGDGRTVARCSNCGLEAVGEVSRICACGIRRGKYDRLRCQRLAKPIPGVMAQVVVVEVDSPPEPKPAPSPKPASTQPRGGAR
jgi:hypothetical protein